MQKSKIEWTDYTWNPVTGCSFGCSYCYARKMAENPFYRKAFPNKFEPTFHENRLDEPLKVPAGSKVFVCSMGELFSDDVGKGLIEMIFQRIKARPDVIFQLLTKQPQNLIKWSPFPKNCWVGVSATDTPTYQNACLGLREVEARVRFISFEPLLGAIYTQILNPMPEYYNPRGIPFDWVIIGQQTPANKKTAPRIDWIQEIVEAADKAEIPVFLKNNLQNLSPSKWRNLRQEFPSIG